ncbi:MAG: acetyl/propionyl/methylcrotonyl-CoA carboxylase subunit alpha [Burkholderiaceae bacterium]
MLDKILIANRGEIACRVAATARRMGIRTVAVYSDADAGARHVAACDEAWRLGPAPVRESYLRADLIIEIARRSGAQAIHPGYGFLSENEAFARAVAQAGLVFIGPPASAIAAMGSKSAAKALMGKAGVPLVPGYHGDEQDPAFLARQADAIGYPVLIKASAGGGGKGMRIVERSDQFEAALASCQREARNAFGDEHVLVERYVLRPRHIEIQVFADSHGNCVHLFERDCSVQRRHQKVIEEAPAPGMNPERRAAMGAAAVAAARAVGYVGAGTVEFIADQAGNFWFMEMNTRLQVEHPVTEMITGQDLVEWQLRVAAGETLPCTQEQLSIDGHAIEVRLYAENPDKGFLPSTGTLQRLRLPDGARFSLDAPDGVRIDSGVREGDAITPFYDPMIAKIICHGRDREQARQRMAAALAAVQAVGVQTNAAFLSRLMRDEAFAAAELDTGLIEQRKATLLPPPRPPALRELAIAAAAVAVLERTGGPAAPAARPDHEAAGTDAAWHDPWTSADGWRHSGAWLVRSLRFSHGDADYEVSVEYDRSGWTVRAGDEAVRLTGLSFDTGSGTLRGLVGDTVFEVGIALAGESLYLFGPEGALVLRWADPLAHAGDDAAEVGGLSAPMPGKVIAVLVEAGARVTRGQPVIVIEAMKMEHTITAPAAGTVTELRYRVGDQVDEGAALIGFEEN